MSLQLGEIEAELSGSPVPLKNIYIIQPPTCLENFGTVASVHVTSLVVISQFAAFFPECFSQAVILMKTFSLFACFLKVSLSAQGHRSRPRLRFMFGSQRQNSRESLKCFLLVINLTAAV